MAYDLDDLRSDLVTARRSGSTAAVKEVVERTLRLQGGTFNLLGTPDRAGLTPLLVSQDLTILRLVWGPAMSLPPHNHNMWAVVGIESGQEINRFFRLESGVLRSSGVRELGAQDVISLGSDAIHGVTNPLRRYSSALHVYGGDFFATPRTEWSEETGASYPSSGDLMRERFDAANQAAILDTID